MKHLINLTITLVLCLSVQACKIEVDAAGTVDKLTELFNSEERVDEVSDEDTVEYEEASTEEIETEDSNIVSTGHTVPSSNRSFMGTYNVDLTYSYCSTPLDIPYTIRGYSHNSADLIDFEDSYGDLVWVAEVYPDDSFDFVINYVNKFNQPTLDMACTCVIEEGYNGYYNDEIQCGCSGSGASCTLYWTKL